MALTVSRRLDFSEIPVIDLKSLVAGLPDPDTIAAFRQACVEVGFFYVCRHGLSKKIIEALVQAGKQFFSQSDSEKQLIKIDRRVRGYLPLYYRSYEGEQRAGTSHQEGFWIGHEQPVDQSFPLQGPNQWPDFPTNLQNVMLEYLKQAEKLSEVLSMGFAMALGLEAKCFAPMFNNPTSRLKINHYPPQANPTNVNNIGVVPHTDSGGFTILWQDHHGGLEIQNKSGEWVVAPPIEDTLVVNIGNVMQHWSGGQFSSTPHRVINRTGADRYSIPLFVNPNPNIEIEALVNNERGDWKPFNYGKYQLELWRRTFPVANV